MTTAATYRASINTDDGHDWDIDHDCGVRIWALTCNGETLSPAEFAARYGADALAEAEVNAQEANTLNEREVEYDNCYLAADDRYASLGDR